jgi:SPP1 family predicted phage head-tail adaptor
MSAGKLNRRITIEAPTNRTSASGAVEQVWNLFANAWAQIISSSGGESFGDDQVTAVSRTNFKIRYIKNVSPAMRVIYRGQAYEINDVSEPDRNEYLMLSCTALNIQSGNA